MSFHFFFCYSLHFLCWCCRLTIVGQRHENKVNVFFCFIDWHLHPKVEKKWSEKRTKSQKNMNVIDHLENESLQLMSFGLRAIGESMSAELCDSIFEIGKWFCRWSFVAKGKDWKILWKIFEIKWSLIWFVFNSERHMFQPKSIRA